MKPAEVDYCVPGDLREAIERKAAAGPDASFLAGGQSLMPLLNMRLARPQLLIDLNRLAELDFIELRDRTVVVGAMTRQRTLERSALAFDHCPLLRETLMHVAHPVIRNRGTVGGSIAHAAGASELPATLVALGGSVTVEGPSGQRTIPAEQFFQFHFMTAIEPDEIVVAVNFPALEEGAGWAFDELSRRRGDFALAGVAAVLDGDRPRLAFAGVGHTPVLVESLDPAVAAAAVRPTADVHAGADYRRRITAVLTRRVAELARRRQTGARR